MSNLFNYGTQGILVGGTLPYKGTFELISATPLNGVQSSAVSLTLPRQDIMDWAGNGEPVMVDRPRAELQFTYVFSNGRNEQILGFTQGNNLVPALLNMNAERNYYILINQEHYDQIGTSGLHNYVMAFGNGIVSRYDFKAQVGQPTLCTVSVDCLNVLIQGTGSGQLLPSVYKESGTYPTGRYSLPPFTQEITSYFEAAPSNINIVFDSGSTIGAALSGQNSCPIQMFDFTVDMTRTQSKILGWAYPDVRPLRYPLSVNIHADAYLNGFQIDALNRMGCPDSGWNFAVHFTSGYGVEDPFYFQFNGVKLDSEIFTASIGASNKVSFNWTCKIYDINRQSGANFFMVCPQIAYNSIIFQSINWGTGADQAPLVLNLSAPSYLSIINGAAFITGNVVSMLDEVGLITVQLNVSGSPEIDYITTIIG